MFIRKMNNRQFMIRKCGIIKNKNKKIKPLIEYNRNSEFYNSEITSKKWPSTILKLFKYKQKN